MYTWVFGHKLVNIIKVLTHGILNKQTTCYFNNWGEL